MKKYVTIKITAEPQYFDLISGCIWNDEVEGIIENDHFLEVSSYNTSDEFKNEILDTLSQLKNNGGIADYSVSSTIGEERNWNEEWEKALNIVEIGEKFAIKPSFREYENKENRFVLEIDPKMSFGTGEHQTTRLMLLALEKYLTPEAKVLDVGTGTGVLAIAAVKAGAKSAIGVDNDEWCLMNGIENIERNNCQKEVEILLGDITNVEDEDFDLVLANINRNVLIEIKQELTKKTKTGGKLILSGFLENDTQMLLAHFENHFTQTELLQQDEWCSFVLSKNY
ncbi:MAG: 50S ribosomal protein L11 methyltransferase [Melioribacteraceae bacterium]|nr:50S ribosomal protein L11 methyltransferase [Melioribacteraceae bacterium]MCF8263273.1 50S ribosomal protein L11 methyltransferase [Melioribacteraceae bacterium]MCF8412985.1 50S ribosomal protein L11 methyltransferase [Melioribacteraceae bacterium]MCF8430713.1 50S ribosomal protein L11 methyltransferase [Melioribacteraceae bacterium]